MANILVFDKVTKAGLKLIVSANTPDYSGRDDCIINPDKALISSVDIDLIKIVNGEAVEMTPAEKTAAIAKRPVIKPPVDIDGLETQVKEHEIRITALEKP